MWLQQHSQWEAEEDMFHKRSHGLFLYFRVITSDGESRKPSEVQPGLCLNKK